MAATNLRRRDTNQRASGWRLPGGGRAVRAQTVVLKVETIPERWDRVDTRTRKPEEIYCVQNYIRDCARCVPKLTGGDDFYDGTYSGQLARTSKVCQTWPSHHTPIGCIRTLQEHSCRSLLLTRLSPIQIKNCLLRYPCNMKAGKCPCGKVWNGHCTAHIGEAIVFADRYSRYGT